MTTNLYRYGDWNSYNGHNYLLNTYLIVGNCII